MRAGRTQFQPDRGSTDCTARRAACQSFTDGSSSRGGARRMVGHVAASTKWKHSHRFPVHRWTFLSCRDVNNLSAELRSRRHLCKTGSGEQTLGAPTTLHLEQLEVPQTVATVAHDSEDVERRQFRRPVKVAVVTQRAEDPED